MTQVAASVIIPTRNRAALLELTLPGLLNQSMPPGSYEVIVADDGSTDSTPQLGDRLTSDVFHYLPLPPNGASIARNHALTIARGSIVVFLDDDAFVGPNFVATHLAAHRGGVRLVVAGGIVQVREVPRQIDESPGLRSYHRHPMPGGNASVALADVLSLGGFDESFRVYGWQDQELAERLLASGVRRRFVWGAPIYHYKAAGYDADLRAQLERELERGRMGARMYRKHRRMTVGITTKLWPPVRMLERAADRVFALGPQAAAILRGEATGADVPAWKAALLRAHVEIGAGRRELAAMATPGAT